jgi:hypothetical protein
VATEEIIDLHTDGKSDRRTKFRLIKIGSGKSVSPFPGAERAETFAERLLRRIPITLETAAEKDLGRALWLPRKIIAAEHRHCSSGEEEERCRAARSLECDMYIYVRVSIYLAAFGVCGAKIDVLVCAAGCVFYILRSPLALSGRYISHSAIKASFLCT